MRIRLTQLDGALPNLALMKLSHYHKARGDEVFFSRASQPDLFEGKYDVVYGSTIFEFTTEKVARFLESWPDAILGGTGSSSHRTVEDVIGRDSYEHYDYTIYPHFVPSIGFNQRGCRLSCKFCVVPGKEGKARSTNTIADIWRGEGSQKKLHLLDNDFFGQPEHDWQSRVAEIVDGGFKVCLNQGINVRHLTPAAAAALAQMEYRDDAFSKRRIYTAWDNLKDEAVFFRGIDMLEAAGIPARHIRSYMLIGYDKNETWERIHSRFDKMHARGIEPYPMVYDTRSVDLERFRALKRFQRWAVTGLYRAVPFSDYDASRRSARGVAVEPPAILPGLSIA